MESRKQWERNSDLGFYFAALIPSFVVLRFSGVINPALITHISIKLPHFESVKSFVSYDKI